MTANKEAANNFAEYLQTVVKFSALETITSKLDKELAESQKVMDEIKNMFNYTATLDSEAGLASGNISHTDVLNFLETGPPQVLLPDMPTASADVDLDSVIASMKLHAEDLKKKIVLSESQLPKINEMKSLEFKHYVSSLDQLGKRLVAIRYLQKDEINRRNEVLEAKLTLLCDYINTFTQMVNTKTALSESNKNWTPTQDNNALAYDNILNQLLVGINDVTYLLHDKN